MAETTLIGLGSIIVLGITAQWLAWRIHFPSILLLLVFGFIAGPVTGFLKPDALLGDLLAPIVSLSVAVILLEGGLSLKIRELRVTKSVVRNLISIGAIITWLMSAFFAYLILDLEIPLAFLLGAVLVVTGPTVIIPLLRHIRPSDRVGSILKWEGILNDPIGAMMAVLVFEAILLKGLQDTPALIAFGVARTVLIGSIAGVLGAGIIILLFKKYWVPDYLQNPVTLIIALSAYTFSNLFQTESGLLAVTVMGMVLGNQKSVSMKHIIEFKENLQVLLISSIFILLAARLELKTLEYISLSSLVFLGVLILIVRPLAVLLCSLGSKLDWKERFFLSSLAPRGIVAAAVSSVFALRLIEIDYPQAEELVPLTFLFIIGTVAVYGLAASPIARWLKLSHPDPQGVLILGAHDWARRIANALKAKGYRVLLVDTNRADVSDARMDGLQAFCGNILSDYFLHDIDLGGIGRLIALTSNDEINSLAALHFDDIFGRSEVYQLPPQKRKENGKDMFPKHLRGRLLFGEGINYKYLSQRFSGGAVIKVTKLSESFYYADFQKLYKNKAVPLFSMNKDGDLTVFTTDDTPEPQPEELLISLVDPLKKNNEKKSKTHS